MYFFSSAPAIFCNKSQFFLKPHLYIYIYILQSMTFYAIMKNTKTAPAAHPHISLKTSYFLQENAIFLKLICSNAFYILQKL